MRGRCYRWPVLALINVLLATLLFCLVEGMSSVILCVEEYGQGKVNRAEMIHARYDKDLGWVSIPKTFIKDMYGPGQDLTINSRAFRGRADCAERIPAGKIRVVCSGDSFTFGVGVGDGNTWCHLLTELDERLETVNMGQGGYGIDQAYLWYLRDGKTLDHDIHLFAFIYDDFYRLSEAKFRGYGKPFLQVEGGNLVIRNVPVPRMPYIFHVSENTKMELEKLRIVQLYRRHFPAKPRSYPTDHIEQVATSVFSSLAKINAGKGSALFLVYLPTLEDYVPGDLDRLRWWLAEACEWNGFRLLDLTGEFRKIPASAVQGMFISDVSSSQYQDPRGHYTEAGNRFVAEALYRRLAAEGKNAGGRLDRNPSRAGR